MIGDRPAATRVRLDYGVDGLDVDLPSERITIIEPVFRPAVADAHAALVAALRAPIGRPPLRELARPGQKIAISVCDITRPQPRREMLAALFAEMPDVRAEDVTILIATGTHRTNTSAELDAMLGAGIVRRYRVLNHDSRDRASLAAAGNDEATASRCGSNASSSTRTSGSRPASSSRTSSPASAAGRRWSRRGSPASTP